jgi:pyruvate,orthophosphate dikinase
MHAAEGILTTRGGMTSHAAVVARGMGKPCVSGAGSIHVNYDEEQFTVMGQTLKSGDVITIDGGTGQVMRGEIPTIKPELSGDFGRIMEWADEVRKLGVRANADTPTDARMARDFGAEGIGLCRTEHMFFDSERIAAVREMIVSETEDQRRKALAKLLPMQRDDFVELFEIMAGLPVTIRLLDPPLHEFLPHGEEEILEVADNMDVDPELLRARVVELDEFNPMLGHRGCRLAVSYPEIAEMQARAIFEAVAQVRKDTGKAPIPEVMIPLITGKPEYDLVAGLIEAVHARVEQETGEKIEYLCGTMIELPRACLKADEIAEAAEFFSFGTNDLTQTAFGISRDDSARFMDDYIRKGIMERDPFISIDTEGVGELVRIGVERGRKSRPDIKLGICGEHGGDPASVHFCHETGLDYVSCSPFRVPIARLAAAQAAVKDSEH